MGLDCSQDAYDQVVADLYGAAAGLQQWEVALARFAALTQSQVALFQSFARQSSPRQLICSYDSGNLGQDVMSNYAAFVSEFGDPRVEFASANSARMWTDFDFIDTRRMRRHPYYAEVLGPLDLQYAMGSASHVTRWSLGGFSLQRSSRAGPFDEATKQIFRAVTNHGANALNLAEVRLSLGARSISSAAIQSTGSAAILVNSDCRILDVSERAEKILQTTVGVGIHGGRISSSHPPFCVALARTVRDVCEGRRVANTLTSDTLQFRVTQVAANESGYFLRGVALISLQDLPSGDPFSNEAVRLGVTPAELEVCRLLYEGLGPATIAERRNVAPATVRAQLKSIYLKLDVRSQRELISRMAREQGIGS